MTSLLECPLCYNSFIPDLMVKCTQDHIHACTWCTRYIPTETCSTCSMELFTPNSPTTCIEYYIQKKRGIADWVVEAELYRNYSYYMVINNHLYLGFNKSDGNILYEGIITPVGGTEKEPLRNLGVSINRFRNGFVFGNDFYLPKKIAMESEHHKQTMHRQFVNGMVEFENKKYITAMGEGW